MRLQKAKVIYNMRMKMNFVSRSRPAGDCGPERLYEGKYTYLQKHCRQCNRVHFKVSKAEKLSIASIHVIYNKSVIYHIIVHNNIKLNILFKPVLSRSKGKSELAISYYVGVYKQ